MWPKAFAQFVELAPHISRLLPMADRFFQSKTAADDAQRRTLDAFSEDVGKRLDAFTTASREQLAQLTAATTQHTAQLGALTQRMERAANDAQAARLTAESLDGRLGRLEAQHRRLSTLLLVTCLLVAAALALLLFLVFHLH